MGLIERNNQIEEVLRELNNKIYELGLVRGYSKGFDDGVKCGLEVARNEYKSAISEGLRFGSKKCARVMGKW